MSKEKTVAVRHSKRKMSLANRVFYIVDFLFLLFLFLIVLYPILNVVASSFSSPSAVNTGKVTIYPIGFNVQAYVQLFQSRLLMTGYRNSIIYTVLGTCINIFMTVLAAYPLSVKDFVGRKFLNGLFVFVMIVSAPLIPTYLNIRSLGLLDSIWVMVLPGAISVYNMIICRTYFMNSIPYEMTEAAYIDGANDIQILTRLILPLSKSVLAVLVLYYAVGHWNTYFNCYIYMSSESKMNLQVVLRNLMATASALSDLADATVEQAQRAAFINVLKYAVIVCGSLPMVILYPFVQKYFVKGVMIGSIKG